MKKSKKRGFTLIEIMIVVAIIGMLAAIAVPMFIRARINSQRGVCIANLRLMDSAITSWAFESRKGVGDPIDSAALFGPTNLIRQMPTCPAGGTFGFESVGSKPQVTCTFSTELGHALP